MYKIMITVRNRLAITKKCLRAIEIHSKLPRQIYIYDNQTNHNLKEHFEYYYKLFEKKRVAKVTFNTNESTFNAFSKAVACNEFGLLHEQDPNKDKCEFLVFLDNDIIVTPGWDKTLRHAWSQVENMKLDNIKVISQRPGGIKECQKLSQDVAGYKAIVGKLGGSAMWCVKSNFFRDVGFLNIKELVNQVKRHDQLYWKALSRSSNGNRYILGLEAKLGIHCGSVAGSICNALNKDRNADINFDGADKSIDKMSFDDFYKLIEKDQRLANDW